MTTKNLPPPHLFQTNDQDRRDRKVPRVCLHCPLPESRLDVHPATLPPTPEPARQLDARRMGETE